MQARQPLTFVYRNIVFGAKPDDVWAVYRLDMHSYGGLSRNRKVELLTLLATFAYTLEADFSLLRVSRPWNVRAYVDGAQLVADAGHVHRRRFGDYLARHADELAHRRTARPETYLSVRLAGGSRSVADHVTGAVRAGNTYAERMQRLLGLGDPRGISQRRLDDLVALEATMFGRALDYLACDRASTAELQWLIERSFCAGACDPEVDGRFMPQALVVEAGDDREGLFYRPLECDLLRLMDRPVNVERRGLRIECEQGDSHQALLTVGALPQVAPFPGRLAEFLFAPLEAVPFPVDAAFSARVLSNDEATTLVRRKIVDADNTYREESHGDHGPSANSAIRPQAARELEEYLTSGERPPLLRASTCLRVAADSRELREERVEALRREYGSIKLHRPLGEQVRLFVQHLPGQASQVPDYDDYLTVEQFGASMPVATHAVGAEVGPYIGYTLSGSCQPVLFDTTEAPRASRPPAVLCAGTLGSGKTIGAELLAYQAFLAGDRIVDVDPKGDHKLWQLCGDPHVERIELSPDPRYQGMLDPLRIGPPDTRNDLAYAFLVALLPQPVKSAWQTEIRRAIEQVAGNGGRTCGEVVTELARGNAAAREAGEAIAVHASAGLLRLGFATPDYEPPDPGARQVTCLTIANLTLPSATTAKADFSSEERTGVALLHLLATYALHLMAEDWGRHKILLFDEAWMLLGTPAGRALVDRINRLGRSQNATPILATQALADVAEMENLIGAVFQFGVETDQEATRALELLRLDPDDERLRQQLIGFRQGRCLMRDYQGRVSAIQIDLVDPRLLDALDTTPRTDSETDAAPAPV